MWNKILGCNILARSFYTCYFRAMPYPIPATPLLPTHGLNKGGLCAKLGKSDVVLLFSMILAGLFSVHGITWGQVECWNRDQMALRALGKHGKPYNYKKPPLHTFLNRLVVQSTVKGAEKVASWASGRKQDFSRGLLVCSRLLVIAMFLGTMAISFALTKQFYGVAAARVVALFFGTSAGFIGFNHFLSCDSPLLFWMVLAFYFATRILSEGATIHYILAGVATGAATNTKYNGLAVGISIVAAHFLAKRGSSLRDLILHRGLVLGLLSVPVAIVATNPFMISDHRKFITDFMYNYFVTPQYEGQTEGVGYWNFLLKIPEVAGMPGTVLLIIACACSLGLSCFRYRFSSAEAKCQFAALSVVTLYFLKIGAFPRMETRFALPVVPFLIMLGSGFFKELSSRRSTQAILWMLLAPILLYNVACSFHVGQRFNDDPRNEAINWVVQNVKPGQVLESTSRSPHWCKLPEIEGVEIFVGKAPKETLLKDGLTLDYRMPGVNERGELFAKLFKGNKWVEGEALKREGDPDLSQFSLEALQRRNPDIITVHSSDLDFEAPNLRHYYAELLQEKYAYRKVYERKTPPEPAWVYPRNIDFLSGRMWILARHQSGTR